MGKPILREKVRQLGGQMLFFLGAFTYTITPARSPALLPAACIPLACKDPFSQPMFCPSQSTCPPGLLQPLTCQATSHMPTS